jgi:hypothetical protein
MSYRSALPNMVLLSHVLQIPLYYYYNLQKYSYFHWLKLNTIMCYDMANQLENSLIRFILNKWSVEIHQLITAARSKAWNVFACSNTGVVSSNPSRSINVCERLFCPLVETLCRADPPSKQSYRLCIGSQTDKEARAQQWAVEALMNE